MWVDGSVGEVFVGLREKVADFLRPAASVGSDGLGFLEGGWRNPRRWISRSLVGGLV